MATTTFLTNPKSVSVLNDLLQGEISAVETYEQGIRHLKGQYRDELIANRDSHASSATTLTRQIQSMGGEAKTKPGLWVAFAKLMEGGAAMLGNDMVIAALEEGEDRGLQDYRKALTTLDPIAKALVQSELLPAQERTHNRMRAIKHTRAKKP